MSTEELQLKASEDKVTLAVKANVAEQTERLEARCRYKSDAHAKVAAWWTLAHYLMSIPVVILSAMVGLAALNKFLGNHETILGLLVISNSILSALVAFLNPNEKSKHHVIAGVEYDALKNRARLFRNVDLVRLSSGEDISKKIEDLISQKQALDKRTPAVRRLSPRAIATMKRIREMIYGSSGRKRRARN